MAEPICVAYPTIMDGLVLRWWADLDAYVDTDGDRELVSASRNRVSVYAAGVPQEILDAAERAYELLAADRRDEARAMATHRPVRFLSREIVPIVREGSDG